MKVRAQLLRNWSGSLPPAGRLPRHYCLEVASERTFCDACEGKLRRQRTWTRYPVGGMLGEPRVRDVQKQCILCGKVHYSESYHQLVPRQGNYAFDLIVEVGLTRFREHRQNGEIQQPIQVRWGLSLPCSTINELAHTFLDYLAALHQARSPQLRQRLEEDGGYVLHVDGTCEPGTDTVFNAVAGHRGWSLEGAKMSGEDSKQIAGLLRRCVQSFGKPRAVVRDLSSQIETAVAEALKGVPDLICHYHFLQNVGEKLCEKPHAKLLAALRRLKTQAALRSLRKDLVRYSKQTGGLSREQVEQWLQTPELLKDLEPLPARRMTAYLLLRWLEDYGADLRGEYFPFDLPGLAFYRRGREVYDWLGKLTGAANFPRIELSTLATIARHLAALREDAEVVAAAERLEKAESIFNELRQLLRLDGDIHVSGVRRQVPTETPEIAAEQEKSLCAWEERLPQRLASERDPDKIRDLQVVQGYLGKYRGKLLGHVLSQADGTAPLVAARTNNVSEHRFGHTKQGLRRKAGTKKLTRQIQAMRPEHLLVANLDDPDYLQIVCGGSLENLPALFAEVSDEAQAIRLDRRKKSTNHPIPIRKKALRGSEILSGLKRAVDLVIKMTGRHAA